MNEALLNDAIDFNSNSGVDLDKKESVANVEEKEEFFDSIAAGFDIPLSIFHYKGYDSDFFTSWYNVSGEIFKEINRACPEKLVLNLALSVLMLPYIAFTAFGLVIYNRFKTNDKTQNSSEEGKTKKSEVSESIPKRLAYGVLAAVAILVNIAVLVILVIPATLALATFYLLNKELSHSLIAALKVSMGLYHNEHQNIEISFHETEVTGPNIAWDMEMKFLPQFEQLLRDLCEDKNDKLFITRDSEHNTVLKLSANIHLRNGLVPLRNEIKEVLETSIQEFAKTMEELLKLEKKDITYDKLKELLNEFRLKVVNSVGPKLTTHLIQDAYQVAFIQAIKVAQGEGIRKEGFSLEERLKEVLVEQELKSQGKGLPTKKEMIIKDLKELKRKEALNLTDEDDRLESLAKIGDIDDISDNALPVFKAKWEQLIRDKKIAKRTIIDIYKDMHFQETERALGNAEKEIERLRDIGRTRYNNICEELKKIHRDIGKNNLTDDALKRKLENLFRFEDKDQKIEQKLIESRIKAIQALLNRSDKKVKQSLAEDFNGLNEIKTSDKVNEFITKMHLEITRCKMQSLFAGQAKDIKDSCDLLRKNAPDLVKKINEHRTEIEKCLKSPEQSTLEKIIEGNKDLNKYLEDEQNSKGKEHSNTKLIEQHLKNNQEVLEALEQLELKKEGLLINEKTKNDYKEERTSREKIKFAIIEDELLDIFKENGTFRGEAIKKLLEKAELEYCLAEKCIKYPVIETRDNVKHFCQALLSPLIGNLAENIINNVPQDNKSGLSRFWDSCKVGLGYIKMGWSATKKNESTEGKALDVVHDTYKEVETLLKYFESSYKKVGALVGDVLSDNGKTFKEDIWPHVKNHLCGMWDRFFKDIEFTLVNKDESKDVSKELSKVNVAQLQQVLTV